VAKDKKVRASREPSFSKTPRIGTHVVAGKHPKIAQEPQSIMELRPSWRLSNMRMQAPFGWDSISRDDMKQVIDHLKSLESMTWSAILVGAKKHNHTCDVGGMCKAARECLTRDWQGGADEALSIRLSGKKRIWGILEGPILYLLWWDPDHDVYPSLLKNT
jgi:hypothetical protein